MAARRRRGLAAAGSLLPLLCALLRVAADTSTGRLQRPSGFYDLGDPHCRLLRTEYNSLHDPYLQEYHRRRENFQSLRKQGLITSDGRVVSTLTEFSDYRQYLTKLKLQAEHVFRQEEERLQKHLAKLKDAQNPPGAIYPSCLGERLRQPRRPTSPPPAKSRKISSKSGRCRRVTAVLDEGQTCSPSQPGQEGAEPPRRASPDAGSKPSLASTVNVRTKATSTSASVSERIPQPGPALPPRPNCGKCLSEPPTQEGEESSPAENAFPSMGPKSFLQPVPPAGPKPRAVRLKPIQRQG
ncbi:fibrous sheath-interacting protein 2 [Numenius arquata]|uniref:fibrous sheath-interacting protein 2 n=1 Tax=Numenius arquata TaxID=31919 RepID=UPI003D30927A